jgi:hypothetical protein
VGLLLLLMVRPWNRKWGGNRVFLPGCVGRAALSYFCRIPTFRSDVNRNRGVENVARRLEPGCLELPLFLLLDLQMEHVSSYAPLLGLQRVYVCICDGFHAGRSFPFPMSMPKMRAHIAPPFRQGAVEMRAEVEVSYIYFTLPDIVLTGFLLSYYNLNIYWKNTIILPLLQCQT